MALLAWVWLIVEGASAEDADPYLRLRTFVNGLPWYGVPGGALLVTLAVRGAARRWPVACLVGGAAWILLWAHAIWANHLTSAAPGLTSRAALLAGFACAVPLTALLVAFAAWAAAEPLGPLTPWQRGKRRWPALLVAGIVMVALTWGFVRPWRLVTAADDNGGTLWLLLTGGTLLLVLTGWAAARRTLRPVEAMRAELADITARSLDRRVPVPAGGGVLQKLARTLNATLDRLQSAADRQARFVADASHELRSPVAGLRASLESSLTHPEGVDWPKTVRGALADIARIQHLTDDLLLLTRIDGPAPSGDERVQLADIAKDVVEEIRHLHRNSALRVTCTAPDGLPALNGSPVRLERLLRNLVDNACRHARTTVQVVLSAGEGHTVRVAVRDDGPGIPPADRDRIFERFTRLDDSRTRADGGGAGLGLAIAREIAVRHGGTLAVAEEGPGAVLVAEFPLVRPDRADLGPPPEPEAVSRTSGVSWVIVAVSSAVIALLTAALVITVLDARAGDPVLDPPPSTAAAAPEARPPTGSIRADGRKVDIHLYPPVRTEAAGWARLVRIRQEWGGAAVPGGAVRTPGARLPYGNDRTLFVAVHSSEEDGGGVLAYGELPPAGGGPTRTAATTVVAGPSGEGGELVLGWAPPAVGALVYRWSDGTVKWPELQRVPGSDRRWFLTLGPHGAKSTGYDVYALADRGTVGDP